MQLDRFTQKARDAIQASISLAAERKHAQVGPIHLLAALLRADDALVRRILDRIGASVDADVDAALAALPTLSNGATKKAIAEVVGQIRGTHRATSENAEDQYESLEKFGNDLTRAAEDGRLDPVIGRDDEIRRVIQVLSRRTKNNPVLIGEPGVGKTAIVEG